MKKKLIALLLAMTMALSLAACGSEKEEPQAPAEDQEKVEDVVDSVPMEDLEEAEPVEEEHAEEPEAPAEEPAEKPVEKPVEKPAEKPAPQPKPEEKPAQPETPAEPEAPAVSGTDLTAFYEAQMATGEWPALMPLESEMLDALYAGLNDITTKQCGVYTAVITAAVGEMALVEVADAADVQAVKDIFQARINYQVGDESNPGGAWYPASIEGWKNNSRIVSNGNFVLLVVHESADAIVEQFNALFA